MVTNPLTKSLVYFKLEGASLEACPEQHLNFLLYSESDKNLDKTNAIW